MSPWIRLVAASALLWLFAWTLLPGAEAPARRGKGPDVEGWLVASREAFAGGRWEEALGPTVALVDHFPAQQVYSDRLARIYFNLDRPKDEAAAWERFVRSSSTPEDACPAMPRAYLRAGDREASLHAFERCRDFDPMSAEGWFFLGQSYRIAGRHAEALGTFREAVRVDPLHADSRVGLASALLTANDPAGALEAIAPAVETNPGYSDVHLMRGLALQRLSRPREARAALQRAASINDAYVDIHIALGLLDYAEGHAAEARERFERAVALDPARRVELQAWLDRTKEPTR